MPVPDVQAAPSAIMDHSIHPGHTLRRVDADDDGELFICCGCKEPGAGTRYACDHEPERCNFALHTCCAVAPDRLTHPAFEDRVFLFLQEPEPPRAGTGARSCVACGEDVRGFVYHCFDDDLDVDLHPCCALLPDHAIILDTSLVSALGKEVAAASLRRGTSDDDSINDQSRKVHLPPVARHRRWEGRQAGKRDPASAENTQPMNHRVLEVRRQEVSRPSDTPGDRNRGREGGPAVARHRWSTWNWKR